MSTTVGISSKAKRRDAQIWPAAWNARNVIGRIWIHSIGDRGSSGLGLTIPACTTAAATMMAAVCSPNDRMRVDRRSGLSARDRLMKKTLLSRKTVRAISDFAHRNAG